MKDHHIFNLYTLILTMTNLNNSELQPLLKSGNPSESLTVNNTQTIAKLEPFDQPVILRQPRFWSRAIAWSLMGVTSIVVIWASVAQIDEAVPAQGKLEPEGTVTEVQAPVGGVIKEVLVKEGQKVKKGQVLVKLDSAAAKAQLGSLSKVKISLSQENSFYRSILQGSPTPDIVDLPPERISLTRNREGLEAENRLYNSQLTGTGGAALTYDQQLRLQAIQSESSSRINAAVLEVNQLQRQLEQAQSQLISAQAQLPEDQKILQDLEPLLAEGGIQRVQVVRQRQQVYTRQLDVQRFRQDMQRLQAAIAQASARVQNTVSLSQTDVLSRMSENSKRIAEIDSQITKIILDNDKRLAETESQIIQAQQTLNYQDITAPVAGTIFDLKAALGHVMSNANATTPVFKIVPDEALIAKVFITNKDIGFVREGMPVDVRVDSFPFSEFGDVKGTLISVGSDALPPDQIYNFYRFPAKIRMDRQNLMVNGREISLQSGMSVSGNIKLRKRSVISIFSDLFSTKVDSLQNVR